MRSILRTLPPGATSSAVTLAVGMVLGGIASILTARTLGPSGRGSLALAIVWLALAVQVSDLGVPHALTYFISRDDRASAAYWGTGLRACLLTSLVALAALFVLAGVVLGDEVSQRAVRSALLALPFALALNVQNAVLRALERYRSMNAMRLTQVVIWSVGSSLLALGSVGSVGPYVAVLDASMVIAAGWSAIVLWRTIGRPGGEGTPVKPVMRYGILVWASGLGHQLNYRLDQFLLGALVPASEVGTYAVAVSLASLLSVPSFGVAMVTLPAVAREERQDVAFAIGARNVRLAAGMMLPAALLVAIAAPLLIPALFGAAFEEAVPLLQILVLAQVGLGIAQVLHEVARGLGRVARPAVIEAAAAAISIASLCVVIPRAGAVGAAWVSVVVYWSVAVALTVSVRRPGARVPRAALDTAVAGHDLEGPVL